MEKGLKIGLDVDGVLANFTEKVLREAKNTSYSHYFPLHENSVTFWDISEKFAEFMKPYWMDKEFWLDIVPLNFLDFMPDRYVTSRPIDTSITQEWLDRYGFPKADVVTVKSPRDKLMHVRDLDLFVDDYFDTVRHLIDNKVNAVLFKAPYQIGHVEEIEGLPITDSLELNKLQEYIKYD